MYIESLFDMDIDPEGILAVWEYIDSDGDVYNTIDPDSSKLSNEFMSNLMMFLYEE